MGLFSRRKGAKEARTNDSFIRFEDVFSTTPNTTAGVRLDNNTAFTIPAVWRCIQLNSETIASLPVDCYTKDGKNRREYPMPKWMQCPSVNYSWFDFIAEVQTSLEVDGNAFILKVVSGSRLVELWHLAPQQVEVKRASNLSNAPFIYILRTDSGQETFSSSEIIHVRAMTQPRQLRGMSPVAYLAQTMGIGIATQEFAANFFGSGATLSGVIEHPEELDEENIKRLQEAFKRRHGGVSKSHAIGVLTGGAKFNPLSVNPEESQFLLTQKFSATQIANIYGVPPEYVTEAEGAKGYVTGLYARQMLWLQTGLLPRIRRLETAFSALLPPNVYMKFNVDGLLRADPTERAALCTAMIQHQAMTPNEWRALEEMNPYKGGDEILKSVQFNSEVAS